MSHREPKYWGAEDSERVHHTDPDQCLEDYLDGAEMRFLGLDEDDTIEVCGFAPMVPALNADWLVERAVEMLDEEYGDPAGPGSEVTPAMLAAAETFAAAVLAEYESWMCEVVERRQVRILAWVREHRPDWLEDERAERAGYLPGSG